MALLLCQYAIAQDTLINRAFISGEHLGYKLNYSSSLGEFNAGMADVDVGILKKRDTVNGQVRTLYHITGTGNSNRFFDFFYKVRDHFETFVDSATLLPVRFIRQTHEGHYIFNDDVTFDRETGTAVSRHKQIPIPDNVHDIISSVYFMRTLNLDDFGTDSTYYFNFFLDDSVYHSVVKVLGRELLETKWGLIPCLKLMPMMATGEVFAKKYPVTMWVTDDSNHVPVRAEARIIVGAVTMELTGFSGLKNPDGSVLNWKTGNAR